MTGRNYPISKTGRFHPINFLHGQVVSRQTSVQTRIIISRCQWHCKIPHQDRASQRDVADRLYLLQDHWMGLDVPLHRSASEDGKHDVLWRDGSLKHRLLRLFAWGAVIDPSFSGPPTGRIR